MSEEEKHENTELRDRVKQLALTLLKEQGGIRPTVKELRVRAVSEGMSDDRALAEACESLRRKNLATPADHTPEPTHDAVRKHHSIDYDPEQSQWSGLSATDSGANRFRDVVVPELVPDTDEDSREYKQYQKQWDHILREEYAHDLPDWIVEAYTAQAHELAHRSTRNTIAHVGIYVGVNAGLTAVWASTAVAFPWIVFPVFGWLMGLASDVASTMRQRRHAQELNAATRPTPEQLVLLRRLRNIREKHESDVAINPVVVLGLAIFNAVTTAFPWAIIPGFFLVADAIGSASKLKQKVAAVREKLASIGFWLPGRKERRKLRSKQGKEHTAAGAAALSEPKNATEKAEHLARTIEAQLERVESDEAQRSEIGQIVGDCIDLVRKLEEKQSRMASALREVDQGELSRQRDRLLEDRTRSADPKLLGEYDRSVAQLERQLGSIRELQRERRVIELRLQSTLGSLNQLRVDLARLERVSDPSELSTARMIESRTREMSRYLRDLGAAHRELDSSN